MDVLEMEALLRNLDQRMSRVEQILPTLATRADLDAAVAPLATRAELAAAIAPLATRAELAAAIAPLATRVELAAAIAPLATRVELREEGERSRRHMDAIAESLRDDIRILAEAVVHLGERMDRLGGRL